MNFQVQQHRAIKYDVFPLSQISRHRLTMVTKKVLVLDLDETLIHSNHDGVIRPTFKSGTPPPDFILKVTIDRHPVRFFVHKRPHVDFFLSVVSVNFYVNEFGHFFMFSWPDIGSRIILPNVCYPAATYFLMFILLVKNKR